MDIDNLCYLQNLEPTYTWPLEVESNDLGTRYLLQTYGIGVTWQLVRFVETLAPPPGPTETEPAL